MSENEENMFQLSAKCCLCQKIFANKEKKVVYHDHMIDQFIGAAHMSCNLQCKQVTFIPVIFHDLKNFDSHLLCQCIGLLKN